MRSIWFRLMVALLLVSCTKQDIAELDPGSSEIVPISENISIPLELEQTFAWLQHSQLPNGLIESSENTNFVSLYDNALAALSFMAVNDITSAEKILDFFDQRLDSEFSKNEGGFFQYRDRNGENGGRIWLGDNAWLLIAINNYHDISGNQRYLAMANALESWIRSLQDTDGGLWGGYKEDGTQIHKITEGIITAFNAVKGYDSFHQKILEFIKNERWETNTNVIVAWPENPKYTYALDLHGLSYLIFEDFPTTSLLEADRFITTQTATFNGKQTTGYCFDEDRDVVWLEGTAQMALAFQEANMQERHQPIMEVLENSFITSTTYSNTQGLPYTTNPGTSYGNSLVWEEADTRIAISPNTWYLFSKLAFNPLRLENKKNIPDADKFWLTPLNQ